MLHLLEIQLLQFYFAIIWEVKILILAMKLLFGVLKDKILSFVFCGILCSHRKERWNWNTPLICISLLPSIHLSHILLKREAVLPNGFWRSAPTCILLATTLYRLYCHVAVPFIIFGNNSTIPPVIKALRTLNWESNLLLFMKRTLRAIYLFYINWQK